MFLWDKKTDFERVKVVWRLIGYQFLSFSISFFFFKQWQEGRSEGRSVRKEEVTEIEKTILELM